MSPARSYRAIAICAALLWCAIALLTACALVPPASLSDHEQSRLAALLPTDVLLLGEQHDAPAHQRLQRQTVEWLAARGALAAVALEMAERGLTTAGLPRTASVAEVRAALAWREAGWPWAKYGPTVMAAVRAGVPVLGANLPTARQREAMRDAALDTRLPPPAWQTQQQRIRDGHCNALPETQIVPMTRVQIARDIAMADTVRDARAPGRTVLLIAGNGHVHRQLGVPWFLPADLTSKVISPRSRIDDEATNSGAKLSLDDEGLHAGDLRWPTPRVAPVDYCAALRPPAGARAPAAPQ